MIVRGTVLSEKRVALEGAPPERTYVSPVRAVPAVPVEAPVAQPPQPAPAIIEVPAPISLEKVVTWLGEQDGNTREMLAKHLAIELDQLKRAAQEQGYAAGAAAGKAEAAAAAIRTLETLESINQRARAALETECDALSQQCAEIVAETLARIAGPLLATREAALGAVLEVLRRLKEEGEVVIRVSAGDLPALREMEERIAAALAGRRYSLLADTRVEAGGALVESALGSLDGRLEVQLRGLCDTILNARAAHREHP